MQTTEQKREGRKNERLYRCAACDTALFSAAGRFDAGTGFPSFDAPVAEEGLRVVTRQSHGVHRLQVRCAACGTHLGHLFSDDARPTGKRYCIAKDVPHLDSSGCATVSLNA